MRTRYSIINISAGLGNQIIMTLLSFISRTVFIDSLGIEYLGINALLTSILGILSLAEAGIGSSIMYSLYKPVAENDQKKINILMRFYRNAYLVIAGIILILGLILMPFIGFFTKTSEIDNLHLIYIIFLLNTVFPYFYVHKNSFLNVCQKGYIVTIIYSVSSIITVSLKIGILYFTQNYILFLIIESITILLTSIYLAIYVNKKYKFLKKKTVSELDFATKNNMKKNMKAIILQNAGHYLIVGTDSILISSFISVAAVGIYSNYTMLVEICRNFTNQITNNLYHSVGNLVATETSEKVYSILKVYQLLNFWLYSIFAIALYILIEPFITLWIGSEYLISQSVVLIMLLLFFERGMRNPIATIKTTGGIFHEDRYVPLIQASINLILSIVLVQRLGILGICLGTLISTIAVPAWTTPLLVYRKIFNKPVYKYYSKILYFCLIGITSYMITDYICSLFTSINYTSLFIKGTICIIVPNIIYFILFYKTEEFLYIKKIVISLILNNLKLRKKEHSC